MNLVPSEFTDPQPRGASSIDPSISLDALSLRSLPSQRSRWYYGCRFDTEEICKFAEWCRNEEIVFQDIRLADGLPGGDITPESFKIPNRPDNEEEGLRYGELLDWADPRVELVTGLRSITRIMELVYDVSHTTPWPFRLVVFGTGHYTSKSEIKGRPVIPESTEPKLKKLAEYLQNEPDWYRGWNDALDKGILEEACYEL